MSAAPLPVLLLAALLIPRAGAETLQDAIDAAVPGDTVFVAPGDYTRAVTVEKAVTLLATGPGEARLAGLAGSAARVQGIVFDGALRPGSQELVRAGDGLTLKDCVFRNGPRGLRVTEGAKDVSLLQCALQGLVEGTALSDPEGGLHVVDCDFVGCTHAVSVLAAPAPDPLPWNPARRCESAPPGLVEIHDSRITGGSVALDLAGPLRLVLRGLEIAAVDTGLVARGLCLDVQGSRFTGHVNEGVGLLLLGSSGTVRNTHVSGWATGIRVGKSGDGLFSDLVLGGSQETGNDIVGSPVNLRLDQPEWIDADYNFWGSLDCALVAATVVGQKVRILMDEFHGQGVVCPLAVRPVSWGRLKARRGGEGAR